jgi:hypothetical protein
LKNNYFTEMCSGSEEGSHLMFIDFCITQLKRRRLSVFGDRHSRIHFRVRGFRVQEIVQGNLAHKKHLPPQDHQRSPGIGLL